MYEHNMAWLKESKIQDRENNDSNSEIQVWNV